MKFTKKPITIEAIRWDGTSEGKATVREFVHADKPLGMDGNVIAVLTVRGLRDCSPGDWVIGYSDGNYDVHTDEKMQATYDAVPEPQEAELVDDLLDTSIAPDDLKDLVQRIAAIGSQPDSLPVHEDHLGEDEEETTGEHKPMNVVTGDSFDRE